MNSSREAIDQRAETVRTMFASVARRYDLANWVLSFGAHRYWQWSAARMLRSSAEDTRVLDLCSGTGALLPELVRRFRTVTAADFCGEMLEVGRQRFQSASWFSRVEFVRADALALPFSSESFDAVTVAYGVRNFEDLDRGLSEISRVLKPSGEVMILEFGQPSQPALAALYRWYSKEVMPRIGGALTGRPDAYRYLPETAARFPCGTAFEQRLSRVGLTPLETKRFFGGICYAYRAMRSACGPGWG
jgi:demethylmenaquinone methyltransferase / 2-methoxy-6-polyprenyl-1,4-benzoquinol methylase